MGNSIKECSLDQDLKQINLGEFKKLCYKLLKKDLLIFRAGTYVNKNLVDNYPENKLY